MQRPKKTAANNNTERSKDGLINDGVFAWKGVAPNAGEPWTKTFRGRKYGVEHATGCRAAAAVKEGTVEKVALAATAPTDASTAGSTQTGSSERDLTFVKALAAVIEHEMSTITGEENIAGPGHE